MTDATTGAFGVVLASVFVIVGWLSTTGRLPRNRVVGIRTRATMASDDAWIAAHRAAGPSLFVGAALCAATSVIAVPAWPLWLVAVVLVGAVQAQRAAGRLNK